MAVAPGSRKIGGVHFDIDGNAVGFKREMKGAEATAKRSTNVIQGEFRKTAATVEVAERRIKSMGASLIALGAAAGFGMTAAVGVLKNFGQAMSTVEAVTGATAAQMAALTAQARLLGASTRFSATEAAEGMVDLARAGLDVNQVLSAIGPALRLAQAGNLGLSESADIATNVLAGFRLETDQLPRVMDVLTFAANNANTDVQGLGQAMSYAAPIANNFGISLEDAAAAAGVFANNGIKADRAGTALMNILSKLSDRTPKGAAVLRKYGLTYDDLSVSVNGFRKVLETLEKAQISADDSIALFAIRGAAGGSILAQQRQDFLDLADGLKNAAGSAELASKIMDKNLNGAILATISAMQELILALGEAGATDTLMVAFQGLADLFRTAAANADIVGVAITALSIRTILPLAVSFVPKLVAALGTLSASLIGVQTQAARASTAAALLGGPLTLAIGAAAAAYIYLARSAVDFDKAMDRANETLSKFQRVSADILDDTDALKVANENLAAAIRDGGQAAVDAATLEVDAIRRRIGKNKELKETYRSLLEAQTALAGNELKGATRDYLGATGVQRGTRQIADAQNPGSYFTVGERIEDFRARQLQAASELRQSIAEAREAGRTLSDKETAFLEAAVKYEEQQLAYQGLVDALAGLDKPALPPETAPGSTTPSSAAQDKADKEDDLAKSLKVLSALERAHALELARNSGNEELVRILEIQDAIVARTADYMETKLLSAEEARAKAAAEVTAEYEAQEAAAKRASDFDALIKDLNDQADANDKAAQEEAAAKAAAELDLKYSVARAIADGLHQAITSGDWGDAVRETFADAASRGLLDALDAFASALVDMISESVGGSGNLLSSVTSFFGARAGGGPVAANNRYIVGENGPEMFVPNVSGYIAPGSTPTPTSVPGGLGAGVGNVTAQFIVQGNVTEEVLPKVRQMFGEFSRSLPAAIDARVADRRKRGAF